MTARFPAAREIMAFSVVILFGYAFARNPPPKDGPIVCHA